MVVVSVAPEEWRERVYLPVLIKLSEFLTNRLSQNTMVHVSGPLFELQYAMDQIQARTKSHGAVRFLNSVNEYVEL